MGESSVIHNRRPILILIFGATCISFAAIFVKLLGTSMGPTAIGFCLHGQ
jgi:hypothetical protein